MDFDHTSGLRLLKDVSDIRCSEEEWTACNKFSLRYVDTWTDVCKVGTFSFEQSGIGPVGRSFDVFNDGAYLQSSFTEHKIPGFTVNNQLANKTLDWLIRCKDDPSCIGVYVNHDPTVKEQKLEIQI